MWYAAIYCETTGNWITIAKSRSKADLERYCAKFDAELWAW